MEVVDGRRVSGGHETDLAECVPTDRYGRYPAVYRLQRSVGASTQAWIARNGEGEPLQTGHNGPPMQDLPDPGPTQARDTMCQQRVWEVHLDWR